MTNFHHVYNVLENAARLRGNLPLYVDERGSYSAVEVISSVETLANGLANLGLRKGDRVAFLVGGSVQHAIAFFACMRLGLVPCALHVKMTPQYLVKTVALLDARLLMADDDNFPLAEGIRIDAGVEFAVRLAQAEKELDSRQWLTADEIATTNWSGQLPEIAPNDLAYIILSSGTTGEPKGIMHSHETALASVAAGRAVFGDVGCDDVVLLAVTPSFAAWVNTFLPFTALGAQIIFQGRFTPSAFTSGLVELDVTYAPLPPTLWRLILKEGRTLVAPSLRYAFFSGEPASQSLVDDLSNALPGVELREAWLSSEGGCGAGIVADDALLRTSGYAHSAGLPVRGVNIQLDLALDDNPETTEGSGEIIIESTSVAVGYWGSAKDSAGRLNSGRWRTGDIGSMDSNGIVFIRGRTDNIINTGGIKVHAEEVETFLLSHPGVICAAVIGIPDPIWGQAIEGHVVTQGQVTEEEILAHCGTLSYVASYKIPKRIVLHREQLPTTPSGKIYRRGLLPPHAPNELKR